MNNKKNNTTGKITDDMIENLSNDFNDNTLNVLRQNALAESDISKLVLNQKVAMSIDRNFSTRIDDWETTNQKKSGRCWLFSAANLLRVDIIKKLDVKNFEFSQNWLMFWDKFEKANHFIESVIETADRDIDDRTVATIFANCVSDGGQWNMFVNIVSKYGLVPKTAMPETMSSSATAGMNSALVGRLRVGARDLRKLLASDSDTENLISTEKRSIMTDVYRILRIHLGNPPQSFDWQWTNSKNEFHRDKDMTPLSFRKKYVSLPIEEYVCLVHDPRKSNPINRTFTVEYLGNVIDGGAITYLNVDIETMKTLAMQTLKTGEAVWFGCDTGKMMHREINVWDAELFDYSSFYGMDIEIESKEDRLLYRRTAMNHAMLFTGVDEEAGKPKKWRVENSWGENGEGKGFFVMNDSWFNEHMFEIAVRKSLLSKKQLAALETEPIVLPAWDPMGSLAD